MKKPKSQADRILDHLIKGRTLTALQALDKFQTLRLAARIKDLREDGFAIKTNIQIRNGKRIAVYKIDPAIWA
jgi:hypothetical protein